FAGRAQYPTFHTKHGAQAAEYTTSAFRWDADAKSLTLAKMDAPLPIRWSRLLPEGAQPSTITVTRDGWSLLREHPPGGGDRPLPPVDAQVGLDLGLHDAVVLNTGVKVGNPRFFQRDAKRLAKAQRRLAKKRLGSNNRDKARRKVARIHARIADRRRDF